MLSWKELLSPIGISDYDSAWCAGVTPAVTATGLW